VKYLYAFILLIISLCGSGCSTAHYSAKFSVEPLSPEQAEEFTKVCCKITAEFDVKNGKNIDEVDAGAYRGADGSYYIWLRESGVDASTPASISSDAITDSINAAIEAAVLLKPTTNLTNILTPAPTPDAPP
jgi:hypothetical protein